MELFSGATGSIGSRLLRRLAGEGRTVRALARRPELLEPGPEAGPPGPHGPAVDQHELVVDVEEQRVPVERLQGLEREDHAQTAWMARSASTTPEPWK